MNLVNTQLQIMQVREGLIFIYYIEFGVSSEHTCRSLLSAGLLADRNRRSVHRLNPENFPRKRRILEEWDSSRTKVSSKCRLLSFFFTLFSPKMNSPFQKYHALSKIRLEPFRLQTWAENVDWLFQDVLIHHFFFLYPSCKFCLSSHSQVWQTQNTLWKAPAVCLNISVREEPPLSVKAVPGQPILSGNWDRALDLSGSENWPTGSTPETSHWM